MAKSPDPMSLIAAAVGGGTSRSPLTRWFTKNHDEFARLVAPGANWTSVTAALIEAGLAPVGTKPSAAKRAWERVKLRVATSRERTAARTMRPPPPAAQGIPAGVRVAAAVPEPAIPPTNAAPSRAVSRGEEKLAEWEERHKAKKGRMPRPL